MTVLAPHPSIRDMATQDMAATDRPDVLVLDEFRLHAADTDGTAARIVSEASKGSRDPVPLLTSIDDPRDVATLRPVSAGAVDSVGLRDDAALGALVATWRPAKRYRPRVAERSQGPRASSFRLAVTESGINDARVAPPRPWVGEPASGEPIALLLIGVPEGTHAGLLVLIGRDAAAPLAGARDHTGWPLQLSRELGVRVYESSRIRAGASRPGRSSAPIER